ncbi:tRNA A64-2'-O-ribosylphosphate transferase [Sorochytrium milnesiophthora]
MASMLRETRQVRRDTMRLHNRLSSIRHDAQFVRELRSLFPQAAILGNMRCGAWYVEPSCCDGAVYFKSTDGHYGKWDLPLRRANLQLLDALQAHGMAIVVDSTRKGKRFPDALAKTVPIWCAVMTQLLQAARGEEADGALATHPDLVSRSEHSAMEQHIADVLLPRASTYLDVSKWAQSVHKPIRPLWWTPSTKLFTDMLPNFAQCDFYPVVCVSASQPCRDAVHIREQGWVHIQGAADDEEHWACGLTRELFWSNAEYLLEDAEECEDRAQELVRTAKQQLKAGLEQDTVRHHAIGTTAITIGSRSIARPPHHAQFTHIINCSQNEFDYSGTPHVRYLFLNIPEGRKGQRVLFNSFAPAISWFRTHALDNEAKNVLVHCDQGKDRSVAVVLAILLACYTCDRASGEWVVNTAATPVVDKAAVQEALLPC